MTESLNWRDELHDKYRHLFATYDEEPLNEKSYYKKGDILRGIEVGDSWEWIVEEFLERIEWYRNNRLNIPNPEFKYEKDDSGKWIICPTIQISLDENVIKIFQIKEKFGKLRIYMDNYLPHMHIDIERCIAAAEARADITCYNCGKLEKALVQTKGWISFICKECNDTRIKKEELAKKEKDLREILDFWRTT